MAYVIGKRVSTRGWASVKKIRFGVYAVTVICIGVIFGIMNSSAIYGVGTYKSKLVGDQKTFSPSKSVKNKKRGPQKTDPSANTSTSSNTQPMGQTNCRVSSATLSEFERSISPEIRKLADFEKLCGGKFIQSSMLFTAMPATVSESTELAKDLSYRLKEFSRFGLYPIIIMEPITSKGVINFSSYASGSYDEIMNRYFAELKANGINDQLLGTLAPFPEANIPEWGNTNPNDVANCIKKTAQIQKQHFPASKTSALFDSKSYPNGNSWEGGSYASLLPYVQNIPKGLIDSLGLQGYPWPDPQPEYSPSRFLNASIAIEAANALGANAIWFNTGTFNKGKAWDGLSYSLTSAQRAEILDQIIEQAKVSQNLGYATSIMIFAENKLSTPEGIDWSYWPTNNPTGEGAEVFKTFQNKASSANITLGVFDSY